MMKSVCLVLLLVARVTSFGLLSQRNHQATSLPQVLPHKSSSFIPAGTPHVGNDGAIVGSRTAQPVLASVSAASMAFASFVMPALAEVDLDDIEIAELPPVWVPIVFAIAILGGVGLLTGSLGDVMSDEASLGLMSGAQAKKEMERSRSSYFKKK
uniref:Dolichol phosphate-mannose biosynthesis regulatory protein n=1 Tax=Trieres chinensis TaxID=1514140 RepID=A0A6U1XMR7_TRICV|mmetsp:Transcript_34499/g.70441  ORF Transcript_34499/g.70441 Transcript_34499/m.70441 type:complete len:155 (+) Transcript_34499:78-542(+)|eukprot:CAMPEP_0183295906 /NCGR_PEP_ID=MMETSP0160_2-20130417/3676_1 /TAXON_ID=2839 ORGANISM="Odontella Sinensis, Strain Grunow 1884" /NCGR_SAMPLE_ID=MMETSP0160_2 /ASSEMBLY_ACC=CAM_ASM_000250 /LENGTH=154 /DNA_ID=CAMNT_0025457447 /DNA_START=40 /DNA_END=504 /DNA_ORIENTATION=-